MSYADDLASLGISTGVLGGEQTLADLRSVVRLPKKSRVLDIGCNGGQLSLFLADTFDANVTAIDSSALAIQLGGRNVESVTHAGEISLVNGDVMDRSLLADGSFDLVAHRGLEVFFENRKAFVKRTAQLLKGWGYLVNITHTFESKPDQRLIDELNRAAGMHIKPTSRRDIIREYEAVGFKLLHERELPVDSGTLPDLGDTKNKGKDDPASRVRRVFELSVRNDMQTRGALLVFRRPMFGFVVDSAKG